MRRSGFRGNFWGAVGIIPLLLGACWGSDGGDSKGSIVVSFWTTEVQSDRMATIRVLADTFEIQHPGVEINVIPVEEKEIMTQLTATVASGRVLPALVEITTENAIALGTEDLLDTAAASEVVESVSKEAFYAGALALAETAEKGSYYGVPYHGWMQGIWYRGDWFQEAGLSPPDTWDNILAAAQYFHRPEKNRYGILVGTKADPYAEQCFTPIALSNGAKLFDKEGRLIFTSPAMKEAIAYYAKLAQYTPPGPQTWRARDYYLQGKLAMFFYSTYIMDDLALEEKAKDSLTQENFEGLEGAKFDPDLAVNTKMVSAIGHKRSGAYGSMVTLSFPKQESEKVTDAAVSFVKYLFTPEAYVTWLHMAPGGMHPTVREIASSEVFQDDPNGIFQRYGQEKMKAIAAGMDHLETFSIEEGVLMPAASIITSKQVLPQMLYKITQENLSVDKGMVWAEERMKELIKEQEEKSSS